VAKARKTDLLVRIEVEAAVLARGIVDQVDALVELAQLMMRAWSMREKREIERDDTNTAA
jgi:hypothetical protein